MSDSLTVSLEHKAGKVGQQSGWICIWQGIRYKKAQKSIQINMHWTKGLVMPGTQGKLSVCVWLERDECDKSWLWMCKWVETVGSRVQCGHGCRSLCMLGNFNVSVRPDVCLHFNKLYRILFLKIYLKCRFCTYNRRMSYHRLWKCFMNNFYDK